MIILKNLLLLVIFLGMVSSCRESVTDPVEPAELIVEGVNLTQLFLEPGDSEIQLVETDWQTRDVRPASVNFLDSSSSLINDFRITTRVVSHSVSGVRHYGSISAPGKEQTENLPILIYLHGGDDGVNVDQTLALLPGILDLIEDAFILVIPSFRTENLIFQGITYRSEGEASPWDYDVDDALALLNVAFEMYPEASREKIGILGASRGACVGMLMAIRDPRIKLVVEFFGPTDFFGSYVQDIVAEALKDQSKDLPGFDYLNNKFIQPLKRGEISPAEFRIELLRRSPVYFGEKIPELQVHHGTADTIVFVSQAERLIDVMTKKYNRTEPEFEYYIYDGAGHDPLTMPGSIDRAGEFLSRLIIPAEAANMILLKQ